MYDSADLDSAVEGVVDAIWFNQGQVRGTKIMFFTIPIMFALSVQYVHVCIVHVHVQWQV